MENKNSNMLLGVLLALAAGVAIGYFLASDNKEEIIGDIKDAANKVKKNLSDEIDKGKKFVDQLKNKVSDMMDEV